MEEIFIGANKDIKQKLKKYTNKFSCPDCEAIRWKII